MQELNSLVQALRIFSNDVRMQLGISKCAMLEMKIGKVVLSEVIELPNRKTKLIQHEKGVLGIWVCYNPILLQERYDNEEILLKD